MLIVGFDRLRCFAAGLEGVSGYLDELVAIEQVACVVAVIGSAIAYVATVGAVGVDLPIIITVIATIIIIGVFIDL